MQDADSQCAQCLALEVAQGFAGLLQAIEQGHGMVVQGMRGQRRQQALVAPLEQADIEAVLELADLLRERRLRQCQALGGTTHMAFFVHRDEITQLPEIHKCYLSKKLENRNGCLPVEALVYPVFTKLTGPPRAMSTRCVGVGCIGRAKIDVREARLAAGSRA
ncbi:hypothetical protein D3C81_1337130 [compost metagenome]